MSSNNKISRKIKTLTKPPPIKNLSPISKENWKVKHGNCLDQNKCAVLCPEENQLQVDIQNFTI